jgi:hypothetical protein
MSGLFFLRDGSSRLGGWYQAFHDDGSRLRAAIETSATPGAVFAGIPRRMHTVMVEFGRQFKTFRGT